MSARIGIVVVVIAAIVASFAVFVVSERERAILFQLGKIVRDDYRPGIHFKVPFFQEVQKFDARIQTLDAAPELYLTKEKKNVKVDSYVKWRISDVNRYFTATGGSARRGASRLHALNQTDLKDAFGRRTIPEVGGRGSGRDHARAHRVAQRQGAGDSEWRSSTSGSSASTSRTR